MIKPRYCETSVPQYKENPLIRALGPILSDDETLTRLTREPVYDAELRSLPAEERIHCIPAVLEMVLPLSANARFARMFSVMIRQGYAGRNPLNLDFHQRNKRLTEITHEARAASVKGKFIGTPTGALVTGISGLGKTSMIATTLDLYPNGTLVHEAFEGRNFNYTQIPAIVVECSHDASTKGLVMAVLDELCRLADENLYKGLKSTTRTDLVPHVIRQLINYSVGVVIVDEAEYVTAQFSGGNTALLYFWINMMNCSGVPLLLVANPEFEEISDKWLKAGMRFCNGGHSKMEILPRKGEWEAFMHGLWEYQYTKTITPLSNVLLSRMYHHTQGILKLSLMLYNFVQATAIMNGGEETITSAVIDQAFKENATALEFLMGGIRSNDPKVFSRARDLGKLRSKEKSDVAATATVSGSAMQNCPVKAKTVPVSKVGAPLKRGKSLPTGLLSFLRPEVRGDFSVVAALREHKYVRPSMEFWTS